MHDSMPGKLKGNVSSNVSSGVSAGARDSSPSCQLTPNPVGAIVQGFEANATADWLKS